MRLVWTEPAISDLRDLRAYVEAENPRAARVVARCIRDAANRLKDYPKIGRPGRVQNTREVIVTGVPYIIPYRIRGEVIELLRVIHTSQMWPGGF